MRPEAFTDEQLIRNAKALRVRLAELEEEISRRELTLTQDEW